MTIPVKGLHLTDDGPLGDLFASPWTVVGHSQFNQLEERYGGSTGNIRKMREGAWPTAIFFYRYNYPHVPVFEAAARAEYALAALSMSVLLHAWPPRAHEGAITNPRPIFRSRYSEYFDLPIALDQDTQRISGGGKSAFSLLRPDQISPDRELSIDELEKIISSAPAVVRSVLEQKPLNKRERRLADGMAVINSAFQTLSAGAFVSSLVSATEVLVDSQSGGFYPSFTDTLKRLIILMEVSNATKKIYRRIQT